MGKKELRRITGKNTKSKKGVSEVVSYVLMIVISVSLASAVYGFLKVKANIAENASCPEDTALIVKSYECYDSLNKEISLSIENKGLFDVNGFFIRAASNLDSIATIPLTTINPEIEVPIAGRFDFPVRLEPGDTEIANFSYKNVEPLKKIQIQPFVLDEKENKLVSCKNIVTFDIEDIVC